MSSPASPSPRPRPRSRPRSGPVPLRPGLPTMLVRGLFRRCPWCGDRRAYFTGWFSRQEACRACGTPWRRADVGFELGAVTVTTIITFGLVVVVTGAAMVATAPDFAVVPIMVALVVMAIVVPVLVYPSSYTLWQALDLAMRPPEPGELPSRPVLRGRAGRSADIADEA